MNTIEEDFLLMQGRAEGFAYRRYTEAKGTQDACRLLSKEEYAQCALLGLDKALRKRQAIWTDKEFWRYAYRCIRNEIKNEYRLLSRLSTQKDNHEPIDENKHFSSRKAPSARPPKAVREDPEAEEGGGAYGHMRKARGAERGGMGSVATADALFRIFGLTRTPCGRRHEERGNLGGSESRS